MFIAQDKQKFPHSVRSAMLFITDEYSPIMLVLIRDATNDCI